MVEGGLSVRLWFGLHVDIVYIFNRGSPKTLKSTTISCNLLHITCLFICPLCYRRGSDPIFNTKYDSLKDCQDACIQKVESCNAVNYAPATVGRRCVRAWLEAGWFTSLTCFCFSLSLSLSLSLCARARVCVCRVMCTVRSRALANSILAIGCVHNASTAVKTSIRIYTMDQR